METVSTYREISFDELRSRSVFINCPFDNEYVKFLEALVLATVACGFYPRCSHSDALTSKPRMDRIAEGIKHSRYSIHDLSRCKGEGPRNLARFNMPLELGMAIGNQLFGSDHEWTVLVVEGCPLEEYASDLSAYDLLPHDLTEASLLREVVSWLADRSPFPAPSTVEVMGKMLPEFRRRLNHARFEWNQKVPWREIVVAATEAVGGAEFVRLGHESTTPPLHGAKNG